MTMFQNDRGYVTHSCECGARAPETFDRDTAYAAATRRYAAANAIGPETRESIRFAIALLASEAKSYRSDSDARRRLMQHAARLTALADLGEKAERAAATILGAPFDEPRGGEANET